MADPPAGAQSPGPCGDENLPAALGVEAGKATVVKESSGLLDPTPRGDCIAIFQRNHQNSPFLRLSGEIRNMIYGYVFGNVRNNIRIDMMGRPWCCTRTTPCRVECSSGCTRVDLSETCRTIYAETRLLPFAGAALLYDDEYSVHGDSATFLNILPIQRDAISTVVMYYDADFEDDNDFDSAFLGYHARVLPGLKQIIINVYEPTEIGKASTKDEKRRLGEKAVGLVRKIVGDSFHIQYRSCRSY